MRTEMRTCIHIGLLLVFVTANLLGASACEAQSPVYTEQSIDAHQLRSQDADAAFYDVVFVRPGGVVACAAGLAASAIALPFTLISGSQKQAYEPLIATPFAYTFKRPIGKDILP